MQCNRNALMRDEMGDDDDLPPRTLPDDVVQDEVLRRLPQGTLAVCRCVCKAWRDAIDSRRMLRSDLLPLGIFLNLDLEYEPLLFAPPSMGRKVAASLRSFVKTKEPPSPSSIFDCCNGLLLVDYDRVVNPATRRWTTLPPCPAVEDDDYDVDHVLFDPCVSPHFQVLVFKEPDRPLASSEIIMEDGSAEWPPSPYRMWVYSSETRRWEETSFVREGGPAVTLAEARSAEFVPYSNRAVYYHGELYAKCKGDFIMRITLSDYKYQVIKLPEDVCVSLRPDDLHLVKSKCGVYVAMISFFCGRHLRVWLLTESSGSAEWMLKYNTNLQAVDAQFLPNREYPIDRPWIIHGEVSSNRHAIEEDEFEWDFDKDNILKTELKDEKYHPGRITILGFHPYKEVAFLELSQRRVVAFHLDGPKVQDLGPLKIPYGGHYSDPTAYFVYTPCWMESGLEHN